jgi:TRAP-type uncharacterized transport system substrate-binding protein
MREQFGEAYTDAEVEEGEYDGVAAVKTIGVPNMLMVSEDMSDELAYEITELLYRGKDRLVAAVPSAESLDPETGREPVEPVQLHDGAARYYEQP